MQHPLLRLKNFLFYLIVWTKISIIHILYLYFGLKQDLIYSALDSFIFNVNYLIVGISLWYTVKYINFQKHSFVLLAIKTSIVISVTALISVGISNFIFHHILQVEESTLEFLDQSFFWRLFLGFFYNFLMIGFYFLYIFYINLMDKTARESELKTLIKEAELKSLKYQLNPHFIFNSLNSISSLTITNPGKAREMVIKLSSFLRSTLSENEKQMNELGDELKNIKLYLDIEKIRFGDKFELITELNEDCLKIKVPNMIFQPLFENAIKYGVYESLEKVFIKVRCASENNYLKFSVENNFDEESTPRKGKGIGLTNIKNRLSLIYNQDNLISVEKKRNLFTANVFIPLDGRS